MNRYNKILRIAIGLLCMVSLLVISCEKQKDQLSPMRMFMPGSFDILSATSYAFITWDPSLFINSTDTTVHYTVQVSKDSTFSNPPFFTVRTDTTGVKLTDDTLQVRQRYFVRVKTNEQKDRPESKWIRSPAFQIQGIQLMLPRETAVQATKVLLKWVATSGISQFIFTADSTKDTIQVNISEQEATMGMKIVENLQPATSYHVEMYKGRKSVGFDNFKTKVSLGNAIIIDLSAIDGRPEILMDTLDDIPDGSVIFLKRGGTYVLPDEYRFAKSVTIMSKPGFDKRAHIVFESNFNLEEGSTIDSIIFDELIMTGDFSSTYVFNVSKPGTVGKIVFNSCLLRSFRGIFRIKASDPVMITDVIYDDCVIDSINGYGVMNVNNSAATVKNIRINNCTIQRSNVMIRSKSPSDSVLINNSTFYQSPEGGRYLVRYDGNVVNYLQLKSCVLAKGDEVKGYKAGDGTTVSVVGTFTTSDYVNAGHAFSNTTLYNQPSDEIFKDPENGDFTIIDPNFPLVGDPRWFP